MSITIADDRSIYAIAVGIVACSVCAPNDMEAAEIEQWVNSENPTGISSPWSMSDEPSFASGESNPCPCDQFPESRNHYLLNC